MTIYILPSKTYTQKMMKRIWSSIWQLKVKFNYMKNYIFTLSIISTIFFIGCSGSGNKNISEDAQELEVVLDTNGASISNLHKEDKGEDVVFYNMFSPMDLNKVIDSKSSYFNSAYLNSINSITKYTTSHKIALNIGVYGADLSYLWMFEQNQQALSYLSAIQHLTSRIGIPDNFVELTIQLAEENSGEMDSLIIIAREAYYATGKYLKGCDRESSAVLILLGGWIETLHIAINMYNEPNSKLAAKIITQKYSLASLITMIQNSQDDLIMSEYLLLMKKLNVAFKALELQLKPEDVEIDTVKKQISIKDSGNLKIDAKQFDEIRLLTSQIRNHIIE